MSLAALRRTAGDRELVLRVLDALLELPAVGVRLALLDALELCAGGLELLLGAGRVDVLRVDGVVHEREHAVLLDLEEAGAGRELDYVLGRTVAVDPRRAGLQHRHQRRVPREHADLARLPRHDDHLDLALERRALGRDQGEFERCHYAGTGSGSSASASASASAAESSSAPELSSPRALVTASSIGPTM